MDTLEYQVDEMLKVKQFLLDNCNYNAGSERYTNWLRSDIKKLKKIKKVLNTDRIIKG